MKLSDLKLLLEIEAELEKKADGNLDLVKHQVMSASGNQVDIKNTQVYKDIFSKIIAFLNQKGNEKLKEQFSKNDLTHPDLKTNKSDGSVLLTSDTGNQWIWKNGVLKAAMGQAASKNTKRKYLNY